MADPWFKFYPTDWRADPALRMCSYAARGLWIEMVCLMHEATPYGQLLVNGHCPTDAQLVVLLGLPSEQLSNLIGELEQAGVFSRTKEGVIYSRKMVRMAKKAATARKNGRKGGNPNIQKEREKSSSDNPRDKGQVKPQKPEARIQSIDRDDKSSLVVSGETPVDDCDEGVRIYNQLAGKVGWPIAQKISPSRRSSLRARISDVGGIDGWRCALERASKSPHLTGQNDRGWVATFDFLVKQANFTKLMEGNYDPRPNSGARHTTSDATLHAIEVAGRNRRSPQTPEF